MYNVEIKKLLRRRNLLLGIHDELDDDSNNEECTNENINNIYKNTRNTMNVTICDIDKQLLKYVKELSVGKWLLQIKGITPYTAAGLLAYFNIKNKNCAAQFISYAGCDNYNNPHNNDVRLIMDKIKDNFKSEPDGLYYKLYENKAADLFSKGLDYHTVKLRTDRYIKKVFLSHLFEEMYREEHNGKLPDRYNDNNCVIIEPEVPYTK